MTAAAAVLLPALVETSFLAASLQQAAGTHGGQQQLLTQPGVSTAGGATPPYQALTTAASVAAAEAANSDSEQELHVHKRAHGAVSSSSSSGSGGGVDAGGGGKGQSRGADGTKRPSLAAARHGLPHALWKRDGWNGDLGVQTVTVGHVLPRSRAADPIAYCGTYQFAYSRRPPARPQHALRNMSRASQSHGLQGGSSMPPNERPALHPQIYVKVPLYKDQVPQNRTVTAVATLWLRRMGSGQAGQYGMPHQRNDSIRGGLWLDDPNDLSLSGPAYHAAMPVRQDQWRPQLLLDTFAGGPPLRAAVDALPLRNTAVRPYSFSFMLPEGAGSCFKVRARTATAHLGHARVHT